MLARCLEIKATNRPAGQLSTHGVRVLPCQQTSRIKTSTDLHKVPRKPVPTASRNIEAVPFDQPAEQPTFSMNRDTIIVPGPKNDVTIVKRTTRTGERLGTPETYYETFGESDSNESMFTTTPAHEPSTPPCNLWQCGYQNIDDILYDNNELGVFASQSYNDTESSYPTSLTSSSSEVQTLNSSGCDRHNHNGSHSLSTAATSCSPGSSTERWCPEKTTAAAAATRCATCLHPYVAPTDPTFCIEYRQRPDSGNFSTRAGTRSPGASAVSGNLAFSAINSQPDHTRSEYTTFNNQGTTNRSNSPAQFNPELQPKVTFPRNASSAAFETEKTPLYLNVEADQAKVDLIPGMLTRAGCLVTVSVPREPFASRKYACTQSDRDYANAAAHSLRERVKLCGERVPSAALKGLRLQTTLSYATTCLSATPQDTNCTTVGPGPYDIDASCKAPQIIWKSAGTYLTATHLIVCERVSKNGGMQLLEMLSLDHLSTAKLLTRGPTGSLCIELEVLESSPTKKDERFGEVQYPRGLDAPRPATRIFWLAGSKAETTHEWAAALHDGSLQFPLAPSMSSSSLYRSTSVSSGRNSLEAPLTPLSPISPNFTLATGNEPKPPMPSTALRPPLSLAICIPYGVPLKVLLRLLGRLGPLDRIAVLRYGKKLSSWSHSVLHSAAWPGWPAFITGSKKGQDLKKDTPLVIRPESKTADLRPVLDMAQDVLTADHRGALTSVILVGSGPCELERIPHELEFLEIPVNTIGVGAFQNADLLSRVAGISGGNYISARDASDLENVLVNFVESERSTTHRDVVIALRPRGGIIHRVRGYDSAPSSRTHESSAEVEQSVVRESLLIDDDASAATVQLGRMRAGEQRQLLVEIDLDPRLCKDTELEQHLLDVAVDGALIGKGERRVRAVKSAKIMLERNEYKITPQNDEYGEPAGGSPDTQKVGYAGLAAPPVLTPGPTPHHERRLQLKITKHTSCKAVRRGLALAVAETLEDALVALDSRGSAAVAALLATSAADLEAVHARFKRCGLAALRTAEAEDTNLGVDSTRNSRIDSVSSQWLPTGQILPETLVLCDAMAKALSQLRTDIAEPHASRQERRAALLQLIWTLRGGRAFGRRTLVEAAFFDEQAINVV